MGSTETTKTNSAKRFGIQPPLPSPGSRDRPNASAESASGMAFNQGDSPQGVRAAEDGRSEVRLNWQVRFPRQLAKQVNDIVAESLPRRDRG